MLEELLEGTQLFTFDEGNEELEDNDDLVNLEDLSALQLPLPVPARGLQPKDPGTTFWKEKKLILYSSFLKKTSKYDMELTMTDFLCFNCFISLKYPF